MSDDSSTNSFLNALKYGSLSYLVKPIVEEDLRTLIFHVSRIKLCNNYNELVQSTSMYHFHQSRQVSNPHIGKTKWKEEPSGHTISSVVLAVLFLAKLRSRFQKRFTRVKKETSGSKRNNYNELAQSISIYQSGQSRQVRNLHKGKTEWKEVPSRVRSPKRKFFSAILAIFFIRVLSTMSYERSIERYLSRETRFERLNRPLRLTVIVILFLTRLKWLKMSRSTIRFTRVKEDEISGPQSSNYNMLVRPMPTLTYRSGQSRQVSTPHEGKIEWEEPYRVESAKRAISSLAFIVIFVTKLRLLKRSKSKTRFTRVTEEISGSKILRFVWTPEFHERFINVILRLGLDSKFFVACC